MRRGTTLGLAVLALLAACGRDEGSGELTAEENRQLNEAESMLDENVFDTSPDSLTANAAEFDALLAEENAATNLQ